MFNMTSNADGTIQVVFKAVEKSALLEAIDLAKHELAKMIWEKNKTQIMAEMNIEGLASLIAVYAAKEFFPEKK